MFIKYCMEYHQWKDLRKWSDFWLNGRESNPGMYSYLSLLQSPDQSPTKADRPICFMLRMRALTWHVHTLHYVRMDRTSNCHTTPILTHVGLCTLYYCHELVNTHFHVLTTLNFGRIPPTFRMNVLSPFSGSNSNI
jgi:hypothetical protein